MLRSILSDASNDPLDDEEELEASPFVFLACFMQYPSAISHAIRFRTSGNLRSCFEMNVPYSCPGFAASQGQVQWGWPIWNPPSPSN